MASISIDRNGFLANVFLARKGPCRAASTAALTLSGEQTVDGVALVAEDRVLVKNQSSSVDNGIFIVKTAEWERADDFNQRGHATKGTEVRITDGTVNALSEWYVSTSGDPVPGQEAIAFAQFSASEISGLTPTDGYAIIGNGTTWTAAGFLQAGTGAVTRTWQSKVRETISVLDFIPVAEHAAILDGTSTTNLATYIQAAIDHIETITLDTFKGSGRPALRFPSGFYRTGALTVDKHIAFVGDGKESTIVRLATGVTDSLFTLNAENVAGSSTDDTNHYVIERMTLVGNRVDSTTTGTSRAVYCPATAWTLSTQYSPSVIMRDVEIHDFTGDAILLGVNRNWALLSNVVARYCNDNILALHSFDNRMINCDFGLAKNYGVRLFAGGANSLVGCNIYYSEVANIVINSSVSAPNWFTNCSIDFGGTDNADISSPTGPTTFTACRFQGASRLTPNTDADIKITGSSATVKVVGCDFVFSTQTPAHLIEFSGSTPDVVWEGNHLSATTPYATALASDMTRIAVERMPGNVRRFVNTTDNATVQVARFEGDRATMADNDLAYWSGYLSDDAGTQTEIARFSWQAADVNVGTGVDGQVLLGVANGGALTNYLFYNALNFGPVTNDNIALGTASLSFADLFLAEGGVINWDNGDVTVTQSGNSLTVAGGNLIFPGTATNDSASVGQVGEFTSSSVLVGSAVSLTTGTGANVTSISLTAGDWDVWGSVWFTPGATTNITFEAGSINTTSATLGTAPFDGAGYFTQHPGGYVPNGQLGAPVGTRRISISSTTTVYLVAQCNFTVSTLAAYGFIGARRVR